MLQLRVAVVCGIVFLCGPAFAQTTWYVDDDTCPAAGAGTIGDPYCSIQFAISVAIPGDTVEVAPGTYFENINLLGKAITVSSSGGAAVTIIDGGAAGTVVTCNSGESSSTIIDGFTITNGLNSVAGGMVILSSSPTVTHCAFIDNTVTGSGGGMYIGNGSQPLVADCIFSGNTAPVFGGGLMNFLSSPDIVNCSFSNNTASSGGGGIYNINNSNPVIANCIVWGNTPDQIVDDSPGATTVTFSDVEGGWAGGGGAGNIGADPLFIDAATHDLRLDRYSPCIDAGDNDAVPVGETTDLDDAPRFVDDAGVADTGNAGVPGPPITDMGAYERQIISGPITIYIDPGELIQTAIDDPWTLDGDTLVVNPGTYNEAINFNGKAITLRSTDPLDPVVVAATTIDGTGSYHVVQCVSGEGAGTVLDGITITGGNANGVSSEDQSGSGMFNDGSSPIIDHCRFTGNAANDNGGGMYNVNGSNPVVMNCTFSLNTAYEGAGMCNSTLSAPTITGCQFLANTAGLWGGGIYSYSSTPSVTNCTFDGNEAGAGGGITNSLGDSTIVGCVFTDNSVPSGPGGGMYNDRCDPTVIDCMFFGNTGIEGAGIYSYLANPIVTNCIFSGNSGWRGGGMFNFSCSPVITNCTFSLNQVVDVGGALVTQHVDNQPTVFNCIFWGNSPDEIVDLDGSLTTVNSSDIQGGWAGMGVNNIDLDPLFLDPDGADDIFGTSDDNLRLFLASPCIDTGVNAAVPPAVTTDPDGIPRSLDGDYDGSVLVDMGAYEFDPDAIALVVNLTQQMSFSGIATAIGAAINDDTLVANLLAVGDEPSVDFNGKAITLNNLNGLDQPPGGLHVLADSAAITAPPGLALAFGGELRILLGDRVDLQAELITIESTGLMSVQPGAIVDVETPSGLSSAGVISMLGGVLGVDGVLHNDATGTLTAYGDLVADFVNDNQATYVADTQVLGDYVNNGTTTVQNGVLTIFGSFTDNGTMIGDVSVAARSAVPEASPIGLTVLGDYVAGAGASLLMPTAGHSVRIDGHFDIAINDNSRYDMARAELRMIGLIGAVQSLEIMSLDVGADTDGYNRTFAGHFPIGTLRIGPSETTVNMVDNHDNDGMGQSACEAVYVGDLIIDAGATLNTNGCTVYYDTLTLNGLVDEPVNLIALPACVADSDDDGNVGIEDFLAVLANWGPCGVPCPSDSDGDGNVGIEDFLAVLANWGACP